MIGVFGSRAQFFLFLIVTQGAAGIVMAESSERWELPPPGPMMDATNELCKAQAKNALEATYLREKGEKIEKVLALIPDSPKAFPLRLVSVMRENTEDAFRYPGLSAYTLYSFRSEVCFRETLGAVRMPRLEVAASKIADCQNQHGPDKSAALFKCLQSVVRSITPLQP